MNEDAARRLTRGVTHIVEHVRVEAGLDVWFCRHHPALANLRLRPAFNSAGYNFLAGALDAALGVRVPTRRLVRWEGRLMMFCHGALFFVKSVARRVCWKDTTVASAPRMPALLVRTVSRLGAHDSVVNAYLTPDVPGDRLVRNVEDALRVFDRMLRDIVMHGPVSCRLQP